MQCVTKNLSSDISRISCSIPHDERILSFQGSSSNLRGIKSYNNVKFQVDNLL